MVLKEYDFIRYEMNRFICYSKLLTEKDYLEYSKIYKGTFTGRVFEIEKL